MRVWAMLLLAVGLGSGTGCKIIERWTKDGDDRPLFGEPASRTRTRNDDPNLPPKNWLDNPNLPGGKAANIPNASTLGDPRDPNFDIRTEVKGVLAGVVVDPEGRGVPDLDLQIDLADPMRNAGAPVSVQTDRQGYFLIRGLTPNQTYTLTAEHKQGGRILQGQSIARTPSPYVRIQLRDDITLAPGRSAPEGDRSREDLPPNGSGSRSPTPAASIPGGPPALFDTPSDNSRRDLPNPIPRGVDTSLPYPKESRPSDGAYSPVPPAASRPQPAPIARPHPPAPPRSDLVAPGPAPEHRPPVTTIPNPISPPREEQLLPPPSISKHRGKQVGAFSLVDSLGRERAFPGNQGLVLLDFMSTTCIPCRKAIPDLMDLQRRYGAVGLEVVAILCDEANEPTRRQLASRYGDEHRLNYLVYTEPGTRPGTVMNRFQVEAYPTLVLIDTTGSILWQGPASSRGELERVLQSRLQSK